MKKLIAEQNTKNDRLAKTALMLLFFFVSALLVAKVVMANRLVEASGKLRDLDRKITATTATNSELSESVRGVSSLASLEIMAAQQGFVKSQKFSVVKPNDSVALKQSLPLTSDSNQ